MATERDQLILARLGQGRFRDALLKWHRGCVLCGLKERALLLASHIKPWAVADNAERLDPEHGLLLCPVSDRLFDAGFISFDQEGMIVSPSSTPAITRLICKRVGVELPAERTTSVATSTRSSGFSSCAY